MDAYERECDYLVQALEDGDISNAEYHREMAQLSSEAQEAGYFD